MDSLKPREWLSGNAIYTPAFVKSHAEEITAMVNSINNPQNNKLLHQTLPISMRRRAMSHNPKRIPRKYRRVHQSQMSKGGDPAPTKRPSRRYRRRPSNLMKEYMRRRMKNVWLETHIWHAKRFHMTNRFGYRLPLSACAKSYRSSYRATARYCLLQDISYMGCIEITGMIDVLNAGFRRMTSSKCGLTLSAKIYSAGSREGRVDLFKADAYPEQSLGNVSFVWRQVMGETEKRSLWIFAHPTFYRELVEELCVVFDLKNVSKVVKEDMEVDNVQKKRVDSSIRNPKYVNAATKVSLEELKDTMNRFRLTGPLSQAILHKSLRPARINGDNWLTKWSEGKREAVHTTQTRFWDATETVASPAELSPHLVLTLNVEDPRIHRPGIRKRALPKFDDDLRFNPAVVEMPQYAAVSAIWSSRIRRKLVEEMLTTHQYNKLREKHVLVPGEPSTFEQMIQPIPMMLIQRPGCLGGGRKPSGYGSGWDVVVPSGYGLVLWHNLILWGAKAGGLRETETLSRESGHDDHLPDTIFARKEADRKFLEQRAKYFRMPSNKRENYTKLGIASPFRCEWQRLTTDWGGGESPFYVVRDKEKLAIVKEALNRKFNIRMAQLTRNSLIPVSLALIARGTFSENAIICLPNRDDLRGYVRKLKAADNSPPCLEPVHHDPHETARRKLRREHQHLLRRIRNRRVRRKRRRQERSQRPVRIEPAGTAELIRAQFQTMCNLWLPSQPTSIRRQCSREVLGYVTKGDFSFGEGKCTGIGYVAGGALEKLLKICNKGKVHVLIRAADSQIYRFASIFVRVDGV